MVAYQLTNGEKVMSGNANPIPPGIPTIQRLRRKPVPVLRELNATRITFSIESVITFDMGAAKYVIITIFGVFALGLAVAEVAPPQWKFCEFMLLAAGLFAVRELMANHRAETRMRETRGGPAYARATRKKTTV